MTLATFAFGVGFDVGIILGESMDDAAVGGVKFENERLAGLADFFNPTFGAFFDFFGALAFIVGDIDIHASNLGGFRDESLRDDVLESAEIIGVLPYQETIHRGRRDAQLNYFIINCRPDGDINSEEA